MGDNAVSELIMIVVEILVAGLVIALITGYMATSGAAVDKYNDEQANLAIIENNLEFEQFNGTTVTGADIIAAIAHYNNIDTSATTLRHITVKGTDFYRSEAYKNLYTSDKNFLTSSFNASIGHDTNGMVDRVSFN